MESKVNNIFFPLLLLLVSVTVTSCRVTRHIEQDQAVVSRVEVRIDGQPTSNSDLKMAMAQRPYHRTFGFLPMGAWMWHPDTTTVWHKMRGRLGTDPAIYSEEAAQRTDKAMQHVMRRMGYLDATVSHRVYVEDQKARVIYYIESNRPRKLASIRYQVADTALLSVIEKDVSHQLLQKGQLLDQNRMESERQRITTLMRECGYWDFNKENVSFVADTLKGSEEVDLTLRVDGSHRQWRFRRVHFLANFNVLSQDGADSTVQHFRELDRPGFDLTYTGDECYLRDRVLIRSCDVIPGKLYSESAIRSTYALLSRLHILRYVNMRVEPVAGAEGELDCFIYLTPQSNHSVQFELDGTNTAGDLGFALALSYQHRNLLRGSETFTSRLKGSYEALSGNVENLVNKNYSEYSAELGLEMPRFIFPFLSEETRRRSRASTQITASFSHQSRPEYTRIISQGGYGYKWTSRHAQHLWDILNISYVYLPEQSETFQQLIENLGPISYSSYSSHFIVGMNYTLYLGNTTLTTGRQQNTRRTLWSLRFNPEISGNTLSLISKLTNAQKEDGRYPFLKQPYEQYARLDVDWGCSKYLSDRSRLAFRAGGGVAVPYGNSEVMPFEKRYYSGGANSVRGWSVRELGPGRYSGSHNGTSMFNYFNQCGDVRLDASMELRTHLFWKFESALFIDGGNVWTVKEYDNQQGGKITKDFYKQIAASWGLGLRVVTDFVILRLDWGFKAHDPSADADEEWAVRHPFRTNHNTLHFAVGYPF